MRRPAKKTASTASRSHRPGRSPLALTVESLAWGGKAIARHEGKVVFVSKGTPGDHVLVTLDRTKSRYAEGHIEAILRPGEDRVDPKCKFFSHCGGCQWLSLRYSRQLGEKEALLRSILRHHIGEAVVDPIVPSEPQTAYRHRGDFHVVPSGREVRIGFYQEGSHHVTNLDLCLLFDRDYNDTYGRLRSALREAQVAQLLEGLTLSRSETGGHYALHMKTSPRATREDAQSLARLAREAGCGGVLVTPTPRPGDVLAGEGSHSVRFRLERLQGELGEMELGADVRSFTQTHYAMNRRMVGTAAEWLSVARHERLLDLYSGVGNFALPLAQLCSEVVSVESSPFALADSKENAARAGVYNMRHLPGDAAERVKDLAARSEKFDAILLDPPRAGARGVIEHVGHLGARRILYVSCNLPSLDRDLTDFHSKGYFPVRLQPWDLFAQTYGIETLCLLERR